MADNPAAKRMSNPARKTMRSLCFARGEKRKAERRQAQAERTKANRLRTIEDAWATPWEQAKIVRRAKRNADPQVRARRAYWNRVRGVSAA